MSRIFLNSGTVIVLLTLSDPCNIVQYSQRSDPYRLYNDFRFSQNLESVKVDETMFEEDMTDRLLEHVVYLETPSFQRKLQVVWTQPLDRSLRACPSGRTFQRVGYRNRCSFECSPLCSFSP